MGKKLASLLNYEFADLDKRIEEAEGLTVAGYFEKHGEQAFRELERDVLQNGHFPKKCVIATGGGTPCHFDNMEWMNKNGTTVYLYMSPGALARQLENSKKEKRPLIKHLHGDELLKFIEEKLNEREGFYKQAKIIIESNDIGVLAERLRFL